MAKLKTIRLSDYVDTMNEIHAKNTEIMNFYNSAFDPAAGLRKIKPEWSSMDYYLNHLATFKASNGKLYLAYFNPEDYRGGREATEKTMDAHAYIILAHHWKIAVVEDGEALPLA